MFSFSSQDREILVENVEHLVSPSLNTELKPSELQILEGEWHYLQVPATFIVRLLLLHVLITRYNNFSNPNLKQLDFVL